MKPLHFLQWLRNPLFIFTSFLFFTLPFFASLCHFHMGTLPFWSAAQECSKSFVLATFFKNSMWYLIMLVLSFEIFRIGMQKLSIPSELNSTKEWLGFQKYLLLFVPVLWGVLLLLNNAMARAFGTEYGAYFVTDTVLLLKQVIFIVFIVINSSVLLYLFSQKLNPLEKKLTVEGPSGEQKIPLSKIIYCTKEGRNYIVKTEENAFKTNLNLQSLEKLLPSKYFVRINRAVIANLADILEYNYWENEKYILKVRQENSFVITRKRLNTIKHRLNTN